MFRPYRGPRQGKVFQGTPMRMLEEKPTNKPSHICQIHRSRKAGPAWAARRGHATSPTATLTVEATTQPGAFGWRLVVPRVPAHGQAVHGWAVG